MKNMTDNEIQRLEAVVLQIGEAVLATTETVERLVERVDAIAIQVENQGQQVQQQTYQIFTLSETLQALINNQVTANKKLEDMTNSLKDLVEILKKNSLENR
jgi:methyl-accepting chemotaxis protein